MNIKEKVKHAIELDRKIAILSNELDDLKAELITAAEDEAVDKTPTECGGWSAIFHGTTREIARVTKPANKLVTGVEVDSEEWVEIKELLGPLRLVLFTQVFTRKMTPCKSIRENLHAVGTERRRRVLKLITSKSRPTVSFETKEAA